MSLPVPSPLRLAAMVTCTFTLAVPAIVLSAFDRGGRASSAVVKLWADLVLWCAGTDVVVEGAEHVAGVPNPVYVSSHASMLDIPALYALVPPRTRFLAKRELFSIPLFGWAIRLLRFVPIERGARGSARRALGMLERLAGERPLVVFPEGTRSKDGRLLPFKKGAFVVATQVGLPIVPVACLGGPDRMPTGSARVVPGSMTLRVGPVLMPDRPEFADRARLAALVVSIVQELTRGPVQRVPEPSGADGPASQADGRSAAGRLKA